LRFIEAQKLEVIYKCW